MIDCLIYVEDPGAVNFIMNLPKILNSNGYKSIILANGASCQYLDARGISYDDVSIKSPKQILDFYKPSVFLVGTSENINSLGLLLTNQAKLLNIMTIGFVDMVCNAKRRFKGYSSNSLFYSPEVLLVPDLNTKDTYVGLGYNDGNVIVTGHPHYEFVYNWGKKASNKDKTLLRNEIFPEALNSRPVVVFISEGKDLLDETASLRNDKYSLVGRGGSNFRTLIALEELIDGLVSANLKAHIVLRLHPKDNKSDYENIINEVSQLSIEENPLEVVFAADLVVGMTSMLLLEASILEIPTLSILPIESEKKWMPNTLSGVTKVVSNRKELVLMLKRKTWHQEKRSTVSIEGSLGKVYSCVRKYINKSDSSD
jgi:hypothetical protein